MVHRKVDETSGLQIRECLRKRLINMPDKIGMTEKICENPYKIRLFCKSWQVLKHEKKGKKQVLSNF